MTNAEKAAKLEKMAAKKEADATRRIEMSKECHLVLAEEMRVVAARFTADAALLRECAAMMRERGAVQWMKVAGSATRHFALYRGWVLEVETNLGRWEWSADAAKDFFEDNWADTLEAAQAAAVAWVDEQEGRDV